jgi:hypothetical protein
MKNEQPWPIKAQIHTMRSKKTVLVFFFTRKSSSTPTMSSGTKGERLRASAIRLAFTETWWYCGGPESVLGDFQEEEAHDGGQRLVLSLGPCLGPHHRPGVGVDASRGLQAHRAPLYSPTLAPPYFFLFQTVKKQLVCKTLTQESFKSMWEGCVPDCHWRGLRHRFLVVVQAMLEVCTYQQRIRQEILKIIRLKNSNRFFK